MRITLINLLFICLATTAIAKPNILLVIADDMGLDASPCYSVGRDKASMPNLEKLCATGMVYENAYVAPTCSPTRATIMTGKYGFRTGVGSVITGNAAGLSTDELSLFDIFTLNAPEYATAVIGKWHLGSGRTDTSHPKQMGVDNYYGLISGGLKDYYNWTAVDNGKSVKVSEYSTTHLTNKAIDFINDQNSPWFVWLAYNAPHTPFHAPPQELHSQGELDDSKKITPKNARPFYNAALEALDTEMGRLLKSIPNAERKNTVVIFIGDNGTPGQIARRQYGDRGAKGGIFEGGTHIPLVISGTGISKGRSDALVNSTDLFATIAELAGVRAATSDSISLSNTLKGGASARDFAYIEHFNAKTSTGKANSKKGRASYGWAIRNDRYKLVDVTGGSQMLFDLQTDPKEAKNLLGNAPNQTALAQQKILLGAYNELRK